jgi:hypothetical protein
MFKIFLILILLVIISDQGYAQDSDNLAWQQTMQSNTGDAYESFIKDYPTSQFMDSAKILLFDVSRILLGDGWRVHFKTVEVVKENKLKGLAVYTPVGSEYMVVLEVEIKGTPPFNLEDIKILDDQTEQNVMLSHLCADFGFGKSGTLESPQVQKVQVFITIGDKSVPLPSPFYSMASVLDVAKTFRVIMPDDRSSTFRIVNRVGN